MYRPVEYMGKSDKCHKKSETKCSDGSMKNFFPVPGLNRGSSSLAVKGGEVEEVQGRQSRDMQGANIWSWRRSGEPLRGKEDVLGRPPL